MDKFVKHRKSFEKWVQSKKLWRIYKLFKRNVTLTFDKVVLTKTGFFIGIKFFPSLDDVGTSVMETKKCNTIDVNNLHRILGHCGEVNARLTRKEYDYEVTGKFDVVETPIFTSDEVFKHNWSLSIKGGA
jgi:hypothetical protein